jgi:hypothetical protein
VVIPNDVIEIGSSAFSCCKSLSHLIIPNKVTTIGDYAFRSNSNWPENLVEMTYIEFTSETPPLISSNTIKKGTRIYVPDSSVGDYSIRTNWCDLTNYIYANADFHRPVCEYNSNGDLTITLNNVSYKLIKVSAGSLNGSDIITHNDFWLGESEITNEFWECFTGVGSSVNPKYPRKMVSISDAEYFIKRINLLTGLKFRLPSGDEWVYAASGGLLTHGYIYSGSDNADEVAWYKDNLTGANREVKQKLPNELGFYDMSGNVAEGCADNLAHGGSYRYTSNAYGVKVTDTEKWSISNTGGQDAIGIRLAL